MSTEDIIRDTLAEVQETGIVHCRICPESDDEVSVEDAESWGDVFERLADHGIRDHGLPEDEPWTNEMLEEASVDG